MGEARVHLAPQETLHTDERRFGSRRMHTLVGATGIEPEVARRYCVWCVGADHGWKSDWGNGAWYPKKVETWRFTTKQLAAHLAGSHSHSDLRYSLHLRCKETWLEGERRPSGWTRLLGLDLDIRRSAVQSLAERYAVCCRLFGTPVVLRSPGGGLHLYWPLADPVLLAGFIVRGRHGSPPVINAILEAAGLVVAPGNVECLPTQAQTLRLPLGGTSVLLDPDTLQPVPVVDRAHAVTRFVETLDGVAASTPLDARALHAPAPRASMRRRTARWLKRRREPGDPRTPGQPDVRRLRSEGLYAGVARHQGAMALARYWMLVRGWTSARCVEALLRWTLAKTNGLSGEALRLERGGADTSLRREYARICQGIERAIADGRVHRHVDREGPASRAFLTRTEADWVWAAGDRVARPVERYWDEVFRCCLIGFAKRYGTPGPDRAPATGLTPVAVELAAVTMQEWPHGAGSAYRRRLGRAVLDRTVVLVRDYRRPDAGEAGRARTYRLVLDLDEPPAAPLSPGALVDAAAALLEAGVRRAHPQQVEHALLAAARWTATELAQRYGRTGARRIGACVAAYRTAEGRSHPADRAA